MVIIKEGKIKFLVPSGKTAENIFSYVEEQSKLARLNGGTVGLEDRDCNKNHHPNLDHHSRPVGSSEKDFDCSRGLPSVFEWQLFMCAFLAGLGVETGLAKTLKPYKEYCQLDCADQDQKTADIILRSQNLKILDSPQAMALLFAEEFSIWGKSINIETYLKDVTDIKNYTSRLLVQEGEAPVVLIHYASFDLPVENFAWHYICSLITSKTLKAENLFHELESGVVTLVTHGKIKKNQEQVGLGQILRSAGQRQILGIHAQNEAKFDQQQNTCARAIKAHESITLIMSQIYMLFGGSRNMLTIGERTIGEETRAQAAEIMLQEILNLGYQFAKGGEFILDTSKT